MLLFIILIVVIGLIIGGVFLFIKSGTANNPIEKPHKKPVNTEPLDFKTLRLEIDNCSAILEVYEIEKTSDGVKLARVYEYMSDDRREIVREIEKDNDFLKDIQKTLGEYSVESWDGFCGANPEDVLDGSSMDFTCTLSDGRKIRASGSNNFPDNYGAVRNYISNLLRYEIIKETKFLGECYEITVPESWVSKVKVCYEEGYTVFSIPTKDRDVLLMRIDYRTYELNDKSKITDIGKIKGKNSDEELFFEVLDYNSYMREDEGTAKEYEIYKSFKEKEFKGIVQSIKLANGYEFIK